MEWRASHILVAEKEKAKKILEQLENGADFAELAMEHSTCSSAFKGGDLGWFGPGKMVLQFELAAKRLKEPGDLSKVVQTQFGFHIIKLTGKR
ncbi:peptidylprolyl isomerase [Spirochaeta isovalerica]|uniref:Parvulin-like peptidyl-prolyl isomerase n=1 Tax=Spirochaeta isovalerica TaxID=150 RepID=A0A841RBN8_9SPIO|nr:peptidylprolyl isomerase [Spirochaeta isovalerica]MBB6481385.1 parvulin-like peptidyl-prolyl isomerase [Spirochaeta isovalerica]